MIIDMHCDTIKKAYEQKKNLEDENLQFNLKEVKNNFPYIQILSTFIDVDEQNKGFEIATKIIDNFYNNIYDEEKMYLIKNKQDLESPELDKKLGIILSIENGAAISGNIENIELLYKKGIKIMSIVWNEENDLAAGVYTSNDTGLTNLGKKYVKKLIERNILIDISHASNKTFWDTVKITKENPIVATHSCVKEICNHPRNLDNMQIKQIAKSGGVIGITYVNEFLDKSRVASSKDVVNHIDYIANLVGIDYIALGSDFDGVHDYQKPLDIKSVRDVQNIIKELEKRGYSKDDIEKISYKNVIKLMKKSIFTKSKI